MAGRADQLRLRLARSLENANPQGAHNALDEAFATLSLDAALSEVVLPSVEMLTLDWAAIAPTGARIEFSTGLLQTRLLALASGWDDGGSPTVVIAYPGAEPRALGGIAFALALRERGWRIAYFGTGTPLGSALEVARAADAQVVVVVARQTADLAGPGRRGGDRRRLVLAGEGATATAARELGGELLPLHPILAARELHRRAGAGPGRPASPQRSGRTPEVHSSL